MLGNTDGAYCVRKMSSQIACADQINTAGFKSNRSVIFYKMYSCSTDENIITRLI